MEDTQDINEVSKPEEKQSTFPIMAMAAVVLVLAVGAVIWKTSTAQKNEESRENQISVSDDSNLVMNNETQNTPSVQGASSSGSMDENGVKVVTMEAGGFYYKPNEIKVKKGTKVKVVMTSKDMMHNFNIDELNVKSPLVKAGETSSVEFTAEKEGTFEFYCSVGEHRARGQVGKLIVE